ncbi:hypothetical protein JMN32_09840 [Fulvivirga sp. 29W222]|uniref:Uncharacterized protein n=1 Tax=Fulvivirga marina TaxID=2494733 RepID=A0A937KBR7_9BACT|nr:hypothetical protein [Fulvivirga marina]MBL6446612.1 hypothetical protein [Fulvivirga marina]
MTLTKIYVFLFTFFLSLGTLHAQNCNKLSANEWTEVQSYANSIIPVVLYKLYPAPSDDTERQSRLDSLKTHDYTAYVQLTNGIRSFIESTTPDQQTCFYSVADNEIVLEWIGFIYRKNAPENKMLSPEFQKGWGILAEWNQGALNPFQDAEAYLLTLKGMAGYTFAKERSGGHLRLLVGPSMYYSGKDTQFLLTTRAEVRLKDIQAAPVSIGTIKFIAEGSTDIDGLWVFGPGVGVELPSFGVQLLHQWHTDAIKNHLEIGISYRFLN